MGVERRQPVLLQWQGGGRHRFAPHTQEPHLAAIADRKRVGGSIGAGRNEVHGGTHQRGGQGARIVSQR